MVGNNDGSTPGHGAFWWSAGLAVAIVVADQATKWLVVAGLLGMSFGDSRLFGGVRPIPVEVTSFFNLVLVGNTGVSFGLFRGGGARWFLVAVSLVVVVALLVWLWRARARLIQVGVGLVIGGALGNVVDRVRLGAVVDFLDFHAFQVHWPAFNLADSAIVLGVIALVLDGVLGRTPDSG